MNFLSIKILFNKYKKQIYKSHNIDLSKIQLKLGKNQEFPNNRDYAYTLVQKIPEVIVAPKIRKLSKNQIKGILLHELGHVILLLKKNKNHSERKADQTTKRFFGKHIYYDEKMVQTLKPSVHKLRPRVLNPKPNIEDLNDPNGNYAQDAHYALLTGDPKIFSGMMNYKRIGAWCSECSEYSNVYENCTCEGKREHKFDVSGNIVTGPCEYCKTNYCICDYNIWSGKKILPDKIRKLVYLDMINTLKLETIIKILDRTYDKLINYKDYENESDEYFIKMINIAYKSNFIKKFIHITNLRTKFTPHITYISMLNKEILK